MASLIIVDYYEIIKELITAVLLVDGYKTLSHKDLIEYLKERYTEFDTYNIAMLNDFRVLRNRITYEGYSIDTSYLTRNESLFKSLIQKLEKTIKQKLKS